MRIEELKVAMMVTREGWDVSSEVRFVENGNVLLRGSDISPNYYWCTAWPDGWIEVTPEEKKRKPSKFVNDGAVWLNGEQDPNSQAVRHMSVSYANARIDKILEYLDKQAEVKP